MINNKQKDFLVQIEDHYGDECFDDSHCQIKQNSRNPQGFVEVYELDKNEKKQLVGKSNLVVCVGRQLLSTKLMNINNSNIDTDKNEHLYWFGLGDGGKDPADPFNPNPPTNSDTYLNNSIPISLIDTTCGDFHDGAYYKKPFESVKYEEDPANDNSWLLTKITTIIGSNDANGYQLSEAGMFTSLSGEAGYSPGSSNFHLFSRVTFPVIMKISSRRLIFVWYLYF